ncbi:hypothetical protein PR048_001026 [Dryococelus australis]|uniref:Uncharacterized protein n=1 Tax=Dryococelus australis TaxID=614101 RepID=A0ABQ9IHP0_9NEOP|nr:hypothetical protein PR048_001026 [Dryococelus australis]
MLHPTCGLKTIIDRCGGQYNNSLMGAMITKWFELLFPMTRHRYIPSEKVFGFIERDLKKHEIIRTREEAYDQVSKHSTVKQVGKDTKMYDYK